MSECDMVQVAIVVQEAESSIPYYTGLLMESDILISIPHSSAAPPSRLNAKGLLFLNH